MEEGDYLFRKQAGNITNRQGDLNMSGVKSSFLPEISPNKRGSIDTRKDFILNVQGE